MNCQRVVLRHAEAIMTQKCRRFFKRMRRLKFILETAVPITLSRADETLFTYLKDLGLRT